MVPLIIMAPRSIFGGEIKGMKSLHDYARIIFMWRAFSNMCSCARSKFTTFYMSVADISLKCIWKCTFSSSG